MSDNCEIQRLETPKTSENSIHERYTGREGKRYSLNATPQRIHTVCRRRWQIPHGYKRSSL